MLQSLSLNGRDIFLSHSDNNSYFDVLTARLYDILGGSAQPRMRTVWMVPLKWCRYP